MRKIAIVHDQLQEFGGAERVLVALKEIFPDADVYTSFYTPQALGIHKDHFVNWEIITSWAEKVPFFKKLYSPLRFLTPYIWEAFNFNGYDLVISSSGSYMCKGIITRPETVHVCYLHHPPRYLYYYETAREWQKYWPVKIYGHLINHGLRMWDYLSSQRVDHFIANAEETKLRISKYYRRDSTVIYPPVTIPKSYDSENQTGDYYITTSRLARAKHIDVLIKAANKAKIALKIVGSGRDEEYLKSIAGPTIEFHSHIADEEFKTMYAKAKGYLFASVDEEFGIAPIEAMGYGIPVVAFASGGLKETIQDGKNGYLYNELSEESLIVAIRKLEALTSEEYQSMRKSARESSEQYSFEQFKTKLLDYVDSLKTHARTP